MANVTFIVSEIESTSIPDDSFDAVWSSHVFHHLKDPQRAIREIVRMTVPGGRISILDADIASSFPIMPWPIELEDRIRSAAWRAAIDGYGGKLDYVFNPTAGRSSLEWFAKAGVSARMEPFTEVEQGPMNADDAERFAESFNRWFLNRIESWIAPHDREWIRRLLDPDSSECMTTSPSFFMVRTWFLVSGTVDG